MPVAGAISIAVLLLFVSSASGQVINGESTYGDSDLHQPPADATAADGRAKPSEPSPSRDRPGRRPEKP